jgi:hypothetical protein
MSFMAVKIEIQLHMQFVDMLTFCVLTNLYLLVRNYRS